MAIPKIIPYDVELRSTTIKRSLSRPVVYTNDLRSAEFQFQVTDMQAGELSGATATTLLYMRDGSFFQNPSTDVSLVGNVFSYLLKENEGNHAGIAKIQLVVCFNEGSADEQNFPTQLYEFEIINGLETKVAQEVMIYDWTTLTRDARAYIDQFVADEVFRDAQFDNAQFDRNVAFVGSQESRDLAFGTEQTNRGTAFTAEQNERTAAFNESESGRTTAETGRVTAESSRVTAETVRTTAESNRVTAESGRVTAESGRVTAETGRVTAENTRATTFVGYNARITGVEADVNANATNLVTNGDFSNGTNGWTPVQDANLISDYTYPLTTVKLVTSSAYKGFHQQLSVNAGDKIYISFIACGSSTVQISTKNAGVDEIGITENPARYSSIHQWLSYFDSYIGLYNVSAGTNYYGYFKVINLTATFGAGNEPTVEQMDRLLTQFQNSWFDGTENLFLAKWALNELRRLDNEKANKDQEAWITPTLLNGWDEYADGRNAKYRKDEFGVVRLSGLLKDGVIGTAAFALPAGYRPSTVLQYFEGGTGNGITISGSNGQVTITSGANNPVAIDGITFPTF